MLQTHGWPPEGARHTRMEVRSSLRRQERIHSLFRGTIPLTKTFLPLKRAGGSINHCFYLKNLPLRARHKLSLPRPNTAEAVPCTVSVLPMMECRASWWSSAACELKSRPTWKPEARFRLGQMDWIGALQRHRIGFSEKTNMRKGELPETEYPNLFTNIFGNIPSHMSNTKKVSELRDRAAGGRQEPEHCKGRWETCPFDAADPSLADRCILCLQMLQTYADISSVTSRNQSLLAAPQDSVMHQLQDHQSGDRPQLVRASRLMLSRILVRQTRPPLWKSRPHSTASSGTYYACGMDRSDSECIQITLWF